MANNNQYQNNNGQDGQRNEPPKKMPPAQVREKLFEFGSSLADGGVIKYGTNKELAIIADDKLAALNMTQVDRVIIKPEFRRGGSTLSGVNAAIVFDLQSGGPDIRYMGAAEGDQDTFAARQQALFKAAGVKPQGGDYTTSDIFKQVMAPLALETDEHNQVVIRRPPADTGRNCCVVLVDGMELIRMTLGIKENDPFNFRIINAERINNNDDVNFQFFIYYDNNFRRNRGKKNRSIDYQRLSDFLFG